MTETLDLLPGRVDIRFYVGDDVAMQVVFWTDKTKTARLDVSAYSGWAASIRDPAGNAVPFTADASGAADGLIILELEGNDLRSLPKRGNRWDMRTVSPDNRELTFMSGRVVLVQDVTL